MSSSKTQERIQKIVDTSIFHMCVKESVQALARNRKSDNQDVAIVNVVERQIAKYHQENN
jgi:hypothetical protein